MVTKKPENPYNGWAGPCDPAGVWDEARDRERKDVLREILAWRDIDPDAETLRGPLLSGLYDYIYRGHHVR